MDSITRVSGTHRAAAEAPAGAPTESQASGPGSSRGNAGALQFELPTRRQSRSSSHSSATRRTGKLPSPGPQPSASSTPASGPAPRSPGPAQQALSPPRTGHPPSLDSRASQADAASGHGHDAPEKPLGNALRQLVPEVSAFTKALRTSGGKGKIENENTLVRLLNKAKPANGIISGLSGAHVPGVLPATVASTAHESLDTAVSAHLSASAFAREKRYRKHLAGLAQHDATMAAIPIGQGLNLAQVATRKDFDSRHALVNAILAHDADADQPAHDKMLDTLVGRHVADKQGKSRLASNLYRGAMSLTGAGAAASLAVGTHGIAPAAIVGGSLMTGRSLADNASAAKAIKQYYRDKKTSRIAEEARRLMLRPQAEPPQRADAPQADGASLENQWAAAVAQAQTAVNAQKISRAIPIDFNRINEKKSSANKSAERDLVQKRAAELVAGVISEADQERLRAAYTDSNTNTSRGLRAFHKAAVEINPDLRQATQLMRDLGMAKMEALSNLHAAIGAHLMHAGNASMAKTFEKSANPILRDMTATSEKKLESEIGSAMKRR